MKMKKVKIKLKMDFVSSEVLSKKSEKKRIDFILNKVKDGSILVTDAVLKPDEEMNLIKETMRRVDDGFPGIEVCSLKRNAKSLLDKFLDFKDSLHNLTAKLTKKTVKTSLRNGITLIGPAKVIKEVKKRPNSFSIFAGA